MLNSKKVGVINENEIQDITNEHNKKRKKRLKPSQTCWYNSDGRTYIEPAKEKSSVY